MKRIFLVITIILTFVLLFGTVALASELELEPPEGEAVTDASESTGEASPGEQEATDVPGSENEKQPDFFDRIAESIENGGFADILTVAAAVLMLLFSGLLKRSIGALGSKVASAFNSNTASVSKCEESVLESREECAEAIRALREEFNKQFNQVTAKFTEVLKLLSVHGASSEQAAKIAEGLKIIGDMFNTVYSGSKTIPAAVKEQEAEKYNKAVAILNEAKSFTQEEP